MKVLIVAVILGFVGYSALVQAESALSHRNAQIEKVLRDAQ